METSEIFAIFAGTKCSGCGGTKGSYRAFCQYCFRELPKALQAPLWQKYGPKFEQAYMGCLSWFRTHPLQGVHRAQQKGLWDDAS